MAVEDHVYEAAVRGRREMRQAYREALAARGEDRTLGAIHARADLRFLLACADDTNWASTGYYSTPLFPHALATAPHDPHA